MANGLESIADSKPQAVVMVGAYRACAAFIKTAKLRPEFRNTTFCNISFVGTKALLRDLGPASEGCIVSQVVPYPWDDSIPVVAEYQAAMRAANKQEDIGFVTLEGYLAAKLFCAIGDRVSGAFTREAFVATLESIETFDLNGVTVNFGPEDHQGMDQVFLTQFKHGNVVPLNLNNAKASQHVTIPVINHVED